MRFAPRWLNIEGLAPGAACYRFLKDSCMDQFRRASLLALVTLTSAATVASATTETEAGGSPTAPIFGFTTAQTSDERSLEARFDGDLNAADLDAWMKNLSAEANNVGAPHDKANAEFVRDQLKQWGWDAQIEVFYPLYPTLKQHTLELVAPTRFVAALKEPAVAGDATGDLVYVNYGMPDDYKDLARHGVDVQGKIVITRYGEGWRGLKPKLAQ